MKQILLCIILMFYNITAIGGDYTIVHMVLKISRSFITNENDFPYYEISHGKVLIMKKSRLAWWIKYDSARIYKRKEPVSVYFYFGKNFYPSYRSISISSLNIWDHSFDLIYMKGQKKKKYLCFIEYDEKDNIIELHITLKNKQKRIKK